jgi:hypothetical protein
VADIWREMESMPNRDDDSVQIRTRAVKPFVGNLLTFSLPFFPAGCESQLDAVHNQTARSYSPTELWDAMLGSEKQGGHFTSQSGPQSFSSVRMKGVVSRVDPPDPKDTSPKPALIFDVDRSSVWNGMTLHGSVRAPIKSDRQFAAGDEVVLTCKIGEGIMPYVYMLSCEAD